MRRALGFALALSLAAPTSAAAVAKNPYTHDDFNANPVQDKSLLVHLREEQRAATARQRAGASVAIPPHLAAIAQCESGGNPAAIGGGGQFRGLFQFTYATWAAVGGQGDPAAAPVAEQVRRAAILYERAGPGQWPVCGQ